MIKKSTQQGCENNNKSFIGSKSVRSKDKKRDDEQSAVDDKQDHEEDTKKRQMKVTKKSTQNNDSSLNGKKDEEEQADVDDVNRYKNKTLKELKEQCKQLGCSPIGNKKEVVLTLSRLNKSLTKTQTTTVTPPRKTTTQSKRVKSAQLTCDDTSEEKHGVVQQQINLRTIMIVDKEYGIHEDTGYLFNKDNQVFGIWKGHGVCNLTEEDKTYLRRRLIKYVDKAVDDAQ